MAKSKLILEVNWIERDTILAALRYYQLNLKQALEDAWINKIATNVGQHPPIINLSAIDSLCEELNT